jgi:hypothetical protein
VSRCLNTTPRVTDDDVKGCRAGYAPAHEIFGFRTHKPEVNIVVVCDVEEMNARNRAITSSTNAAGNPERAGAGICQREHDVLMRCLETNSRQCFWLGMYGLVAKTICRDVRSIKSAAVTLAGGEHEKLE